MARSSDQKPLGDLGLAAAEPMSSLACRMLDALAGIWLDGPKAATGFPTTGRREATSKGDAPSLKRNDSTFDVCSNCHCCCVVSFFDLSIFVRTCGVSSAPNACVRGHSFHSFDILSARYDQETAS
jgi:hypothetical protein